MLSQITRSNKLIGNYEESWWPLDGGTVSDSEVPDTAAQLFQD